MMTYRGVVAVSSLNVLVVSVEETRSGRTICD